MAKYNLYNTDSIQNEFEKLFLANWISQERMQSLVYVYDLVVRKYVSFDL